MMESSWRAAAMTTAVATSILGAYLLIWKRTQDREAQRSVRKKPFPIDYKRTEFPPIIHTLSALPKFIRRFLALKTASPKPSIDGCDVLGGDHAYDPYRNSEIITGKLWRIRYKTIVGKDAGPKLKEMFGIDLCDRSILDRVPPHMKDIVSEDLYHMHRVTPTSDDRDLLREGFESSQDTLIVRLDDTDTKKNGLLMYNPCRLHPRALSYIQSLGNVEYIVSGSAAHTNNLCHAATAYPQAKIICARAAQDKCLKVGLCRRAHLAYCDPHDWEMAKDELSVRGVSLHHAKGDNFTQALCIIAHKHLFEVDLLYGHYNGNHWAGAPPELWGRKCENASHSCFRRVFFYATMYGNASCNGCIPTYRLMAMDPDSPLAKMLIDEPNQDGSSCDEMAQSLRQLLALEFDAVDSVHSELTGSMDADDFRKSIDATWRWLDGKSLLPSYLQKVEEK